jgi:hypothetical protein
LRFSLVFVIIIGFSRYAQICVELEVDPTAGNDIQALNQFREAVQRRREKIRPLVA